MSAEARPSTAALALAPSGSNIKRLSTLGKHLIPAAGDTGMGPASSIKGPGTGAAVGPGGGNSAAGGNVGSQLFSPVELCGFIDTMLAQLEKRFEDHSEQMLVRMTEMSTRIDSLESTIADLMNGDINGPISPSPAPTGKRA